MDHSYLFNKSQEEKPCWGLIMFELVGSILPSMSLLMRERWQWPKCRTWIQLISQSYFSKVWILRYWSDRICQDHICWKSQGLGILIPFDNNSLAACSGYVTVILYIFCRQIDSHSNCAKTRKIFNPLLGIFSIQLFLAQRGLCGKQLSQWRNKDLRTMG